MKKLALVFLMILAWSGSSLGAKPSSTIVFEKKKIVLEGKTITAEIADTDEKRTRGLMFREKLEKDHGMLFIFEYERTLSFWMKDTLIPLAIGYFDKDKKLVDIQEMVPALASDRFPPTYTSRFPAQYALEMEKGWFSKNGIKLGAKFSQDLRPRSSDQR